jgi:3-hydroxyisobutyrate dehydrogenase-like beta-hydroxyacid dehydrogenase
MLVGPPRPLWLKCPTLVRLPSGGMRRQDALVVRIGAQRFQRTRESAGTIRRAYEPNFFVPLMAKDLAYAGEAFSAAGIESALAEAARDRYLAAASAGFGQKDIAAIVETLRK